MIRTPNQLITSQLIYECVFDFPKAPPGLLMETQKTEDLRRKRKAALLKLFRRGEIFPAWNGPFAFLKDIWNGRLPLCFQFWVLYCGGELVFLVAAVFILDSAYLFSDEGDVLTGGGIFILSAFLLFYGIYWIMSTVGTWRSAERYTGRQLWARLVNVKIACSVIGVIFLLMDLVFRVS